MAGLGVNGGDDTILGHRARDAKDAVLLSRAAGEETITLVAEETVDRALAQSIFRDLPWIFEARLE